MRTRRPAVVVAIGVVAFAVLTVLVWTGGADGLDMAVARFAARHQTSPGLSAARVLTDVLSPGVDAFMLLAVAAVIARHQRRMAPLVVALTVLATVSAVVIGLKYAVDRPLPHSHGAPDRGFPSGHTAATLCFLGTLALLASARASARRRWLLTVVGVLTACVLVALVSAGFHWLTDTIASVALGAAVLPVVSRRTG